MIAAEAERCGHCRCLIQLDVTDGETVLHWSTGLVECGSQIDPLSHGAPRLSYRR